MRVNPPLAITQKELDEAGPVKAEVRVTGPGWGNKYHKWGAISYHTFKPPVSALVVPHPDWEQKGDLYKADMLREKLTELGIPGREGLQDRREEGHPLRSPWAPRCRSLVEGLVRDDLGAGVCSGFATKDGTGVCLSARATNADLCKSSPGY